MSTTENCGCGGNSGPYDVQHDVVVYDHNQCKGITKDLLEMFLKPINCYLEHQLWDLIGSSQVELQSAKEYLELYIAAKTEDPDTCAYRESLPIVQNLVSRIHVQNRCL